MKAAVWLAILALIVYFVLLLLFWRCPYCGRNFPTRTYEELTFCPHCGQKLPTSGK